MNLQKTVSENGNVVTISLPEKFDFKIHGDFRKTYEAEKKSKNVVLDMRRTQYMDSSALGMLLQLKEFADECNSTVSVANANNNIVQIMQIAHFDKLFKIK